MNWTWPPRPPPQDGVLRRLHVSVSVRYVCRSFPFFWGGRNHFGSVVGVTTWEPKIDLHNLQQVWYDRLWPKPITSRDRLHPWVHQHDWMEHPPFSIGTTSTSWRIYKQPASQGEKIPREKPATLHNQPGPTKRHFICLGSRIGTPTLLGTGPWSWWIFRPVGRRGCRF